MEVINNAESLQKQILERYLVHFEKLNFEEWYISLDSYILSALDEIDIKSLGERDFYFEKVDIGFEYNLFENFNADLMSHKMHMTYFQDINKNREIIKLISNKIQSDLFDRDITPENFQDRFDSYLSSSDWKINFGTDDFDEIDKMLKNDDFKKWGNARKIEVAIEAIHFLTLLKTFYCNDLVINYPDVYATHKNILQKSDSKLDKRISRKAPTNNEKLKALNEFCPELIKRIDKLSKKEQGQVIHLITGVNPTDAYKKIKTQDFREIQNTIINNDDIDFDELKNKLKNT